MMDGNTNLAAEFDPPSRVIGDHRGSIRRQLSTKFPGLRESDGFGRVLCEVVRLRAAGYRPPRNEPGVIGIQRRGSDKLLLFADACKSIFHDQDPIGPSSEDRYLRVVEAGIKNPRSAIAADVARDNALAEQARDVISDLAHVNDNPRGLPLDHEDQVLNAILDDDRPRLAQLEQHKRQATEGHE